MEKTKIVVVSGIRSQYIKMASFQQAVSSLGVRSRFLFVDAAQHYTSSLSTQYLVEYNLEFDFSLRERLLPKDSEGRFTEMQYHLYNYLVGLESQHVVVFGDANTTLASALAAKRAGKFLTHIEAGVRTNDSSIEEINRRVTDYLSDYHIASSRANFVNLQNEGYSKSSIFLGDIVRDLCGVYLNSNRKPGTIVVTLHHDSEWESSFFKSFFKLLGSLEKQIYFFSHPRLFTEASNYSEKYPNITVKESISHTKLLERISQSDYVITDSGAIQRESFYIGKRVLVVQKAPFWQSLIDDGFNISCPPNVADIHIGIDRMEILKNQPHPAIDDFGTPPIGKKIVNKLMEL